MSLLIRASKVMISPLPVPAAWYAIPLRLVVGFGFMQHGYAKLARGPEDFINVLHAIGVPAPFLLGWATIIVEIVGGLLILLGAFVPVATIPMVIVLLVAIVTVHLPNGFSSIKLQDHLTTKGKEGESMRTKVDIDPVVRYDTSMANFGLPLDG